MLASDTGGRNMIRRWLSLPGVVRVVRLALSILVIGVFILALATQAGALRSYSWKVSPEYLVLAAVVALGRGIPVVYPWWRIIRAWGYSLSWGRAAYIYFVSGLARYLPGQWWFVLGRAYLAEREGVRKAVTAASTAVETVLLTGSALAVTLLGMATIPRWSGYAIYLLVAGVGLSAALLASPSLALWLANKALKMRGRASLSMQLSVGDTANALVGCWANWLMYGLIAALLLVSVAGSDYLRLIPAVIGLFVASVLSGALGLLVPQGIVIREGVLVYLLNTLLGIPVPAAIIVAALTRLLTMASEGVWALAMSRLARARRI